MAAAVKSERFWHPDNRLVNGYLEIVKRDPDQKGFHVQPKRWIVERTLGWMNWWRRLSKDYKKTIESSEGMIKISMIRLMLKRISVVVGVL